MYVTEKIGEDYKSWKANQKIKITAPTGTGKSHFVLETYVPWCRLHNKKVLIVVNRRALLRQLKYEIALNAESYRDYEGIVLTTYQKIGEEMAEKGSVMEVFEDFDCVVFDEFHFIVADSTFNARDTYLVWQSILFSFRCQMLFISATFEEINYFFEEYRMLIAKSRMRYGNELFVEYSLTSDYSRIKPVILPDYAAVCSEVARSIRKSVLFINNVAKCEELRRSIIEMGNFEKSDVRILNKDKLDDLTTDERRFVDTLVLAGRLDCKVLITTSVLDNGISIHDSDVDLVFIDSVDKTEHIQMLGRVRKESVDSLKLFLIPPTREMLQTRMEAYEKEVEIIDKLIEKWRFAVPVAAVIDSFLAGDGVRANCYRKCLVHIPNDEDKMPNNVGHDYRPYLDGIRHCGRSRSFLAVNRLAVAKLKALLFTYRKFFKLWICDPYDICRERLKWLDLEADEAKVETSSYWKALEEGFANDLLRVHNLSQEEFANWKVEFASKYRENLLKSYELRAQAPIPMDKLRKVLLDHGCELVTAKDSGRKNRYTIRQIEGEEKIEKGG